METLQTMMDAFGELGGTLIAVIFMLVALLLAALIVRASRATEKSASVQAPKAGGRYHDPTATPQPDVVQPVADPALTPAAVIEPEPLSESVSSHPQAITEVVAAHSDQRADAEREAQKAALANPYPTDSVLRRHYETMHNIQPAPAKAQPEAEPIIPLKASRPRGSIIELAINKDEQAATPVAVARPTVNTAAQSFLPEDSVLKRHFIQQLQAAIAAEMGPQPSDSVLKRHYDAAARLVLEQRLTH